MMFGILAIAAAVAVGFLAATTFLEVLNGQQATETNVIRDEQGRIKQIETVHI